MKKTVIILMVVLLVGAAFGGDPNSMARPTLRNPVTVCVDETRNEVTVKFKFTDDEMVFVTSSDFKPFVKRRCVGIIEMVSNLAKQFRIKYMELIHSADSIAKLKADSER